MSMKPHCDICDATIIEPREPVANMDLCLVHYNSLNQTIRTWKTWAQGGYVSPDEWPSKRPEVYR